MSNVQNLLDAAEQNLNAARERVQRLNTGTSDQNRVLQNEIQNYFSNFESNMRQLDNAIKRAPPQERDYANDQKESLQDEKKTLQEQFDRALLLARNDSNVQSQMRNADNVQLAQQNNDNLKEAIRGMQQNNATIDRSNNVLQDDRQHLNNIQRNNEAIAAGTESAGQKIKDMLWQNFKNGLITWGIVVVLLIVIIIIICVKWA